MIATRRSHIIFRARFRSGTGEQPVASWVTLGGLVCLTLLNVVVSERAWGVATISGQPAWQDNPSQQTIESWVEQLGSEDFRQRREAQQRLEQLKQDAFDALYKVRNDRDVERRMAARQLLNRIDIDWTESLDNEEVRQLLSAYGQQSVSERQTTVESLSRLDPADSVPALVRIARFEIHDSISKLAAIRVMRETDARAGTQKAAVVASLQSALGPGQRGAVRWLRLYCEGRGDTAISQWEALIEDEQFEVAGGSGKDGASRQVLRDLLRWYIDFLLQQGEDGRARAYATQLTRFSGESRESILESLDWLRHRQQWSAMELLVEQNAQTFADEALLLYYVAEMRWRMGEEAEAEAAAKKASAELGDDGRGRLEVAIHLRERGMFRWAEREYRGAIEHSVLGSIPDVDARWLLAESLVADHQPAAAADLLEPLLEAMRNDADVEKNVRRKREPAKVESEYQYFRALAAIEAGDTATAWEHLVRANQGDPLDTDVLIQMDLIGREQSAWHDIANQRKQNAFGYYLDQIRFLERRLGEFEESGVRAMVADVLADFHNRYAWLTVKTVTGSDQASLREAIEHGRRAVVLAPDVAGYHDTLAHCFAALGRWKEARDAAQQAVVLEPHTQAYRVYLEYLRERSP